MEVIIKEIGMDITQDKNSLEIIITELKQKIGDLEKRIEKIEYFFKGPKSC